MREMRAAILLACVLPFADGLRPMVARTVARPALAVRPQACMNYAGQPLPNYQQQGGQRGGFRGSAGLLLSATGLVTTVAASTFALSASGTIAIIAASAAGLFSFKLSKELHSRGVRSRDVAKRVVGGVADTTLRIGFGAASLLVYTVAAIISIIVLALTKLSAVALGIAGIARSVLGRTLTLTLTLTLILTLTLTLTVTLPLTRCVRRSSRPSAMRWRRRRARRRRRRRGVRRSCCSRASSTRRRR